MRIRFVTLAILVCAAMGCSAVETVSLKPAIIQPAIKTVPVTINVYFDQDLLNHKCIGDNGYISFSWIFELGPPSVEVFEPIFTALFENVEFKVTDTSQDAQKDIIGLYLSKFTGCDASWPIIGTTVIEIGYKAIIKSAEGVELARWEGSGKAFSSEDPMEHGNEIIHLSTLTDIAMRKAAADFIVKFQKNPSIQAWISQ